MKKNYIFIFVLIFLFGCAGMMPVNKAELEFSEVITLDSLGKEAIFNGMKIWIAENFKSAKAVIEYENKDQSTLIGNGMISYPCDGMSCIGKTGWNIGFTMRADIKENRFKLTFNNLIISWPESQYASAYEGPITNKVI